MDHLQEAIEKARLQREGKIGQTAEPGVSEPKGDLTADVDMGADADANASSEHNNTPVAPGPVENGKAYPLAAEVRYSQTRQVDAAEAVLANNRVIAGDIHDRRVEPYRQLRSQVLATMKRKHWNTLAITSAHENAGKTLTAINLAISISKEVNQTVMLVDLDLRKPNVHTTLNIEIDKGIVDHLQHGEPLENILVNPGYPRLVVLPGLPQRRHVSELLSSPQMKAFLAELVNRYSDRLIIFDLPPLLRNDDALVFIPSTDACLLVIEDGVTTPEDIQRSLQLLQHSELIGTILNKAR
jgi:protein-tyrosine kinase